MWNYTNLSGYGSVRPGTAGLLMFGWFLLIAWSFFWKAWALWIAARQGKKVWFGALLIVNTMGILEILYVFVFSKMKPSAPVTSNPPEIKQP